MEAFTQFYPSVCLAEDDLEGVQTLYPDCELSVSTPVCYRVNLNLGLVRIGIFVLMPLIIVLGVLILMQSALQQHNREEIEEQRENIKEKDKKLVVNKFKLGAAAATAQARDEAVAQATPEVRIDTKGAVTATRMQNVKPSLATVVSSQNDVETGAGVSEASVDRL
jgi:hypothetical protein